MSYPSLALGTFPWWFLSWDLGDKLVGANISLACILGVFLTGPEL